MIARGDEQAPDPPGFSKPGRDQSIASTTSGSKEATQKDDLMQKRAMEIAYAPGKNLFMTGLMLWMSGSEVNIFSMMMTGMALMNPVKGLFGISAAFAQVQSEKVDLMMPKLVFLAMNILGFSMGVYKCGTMGLLPLASSNWATLLSVRAMDEISAMGNPL